MLPFIIWFGGVVSWFAVVGEAMIAAPLWAMTHLDGDGEGMGPRTPHGYIFLLNLIFRPVFMVIVFVLAGAGIMYSAPCSTRCSAWRCRMRNTIQSPASSAFCALSCCTSACACRCATPALV